MFLRKNTRRYKDKTYTNYMLVESVHTPKGPRQKVICSLGDLSPRPAKQWLELAHRVEDCLVGQKGLLDSADAEVQDMAQRVRQRQTRRRSPPGSPADGSKDFTFTAPTQPGDYDFWCNTCCGGKASPDMHGKLHVTA